MHFNICGLDYIASHASSYTDAILSRNAMDIVIESLVTSAVAHKIYTRSIAIVTRQVTNRLRCENALLADKFTACLTDTALGIFFAYWKVGSNYTG